MSFQAELPVRKLGPTPGGVNQVAPRGTRDAIFCTTSALPLRRLGIRPLKKQLPLLIAFLGLASVGCDAAADVALDPLPPLERPSPEARAGLPEVVGTWRLTGVELSSADTAAAEAAAKATATMQIETQRLDSIAGVFTAPGVRLPLVGEVRRDGTVALAGRGPTGESVIWAGRLRGDTLWAELIEPSAAAPWPAKARAALVRGTSGPRFARQMGGGLLFIERPALPVVDSAAALADSAAGADSLVGAVPIVAGPQRGTTGVATRPDAPAPRRPPAADIPDRASPDRTPDVGAENGSPESDVPGPESLEPRRRNPVDIIPPPDAEADTTPN